MQFNDSLGCKHIIYTGDPWDMSPPLFEMADFFPYHFSYESYVLKTSLQKLIKRKRFEEGLFAQ